MSEDNQSTICDTFPKGTTPLFSRPDPRDSMVSNLEHEIAFCEIKLRRMGMSMKAVAMKRRLMCVKELLRSYMVEFDTPVRGVNRKQPKHK